MVEVVERNTGSTRLDLRSLAYWLDAVRPRTLPLALASVLTGSLLATSAGIDHWPTILLSLITAILLQILANLANDYGDAVRGVDNERRVGPPRMVQSGRITAGHMRVGIVVCSALTLSAGGALIYVAFGDRFPESALFLMLGGAAMAAAVRYTIGAKAYGYKRMGDLVVFLFFGLIGVSGSWYLNTLRWSWGILLPAAAVGLLSTGVLNLNNMRDMDNDRASGKRTLAGLLGYDGARVYHAGLIATAFLLVFLFISARTHDAGSFIFLLTLPFFVRDLVAIFRTRAKEKLDPFLHHLSLSSLLFSLCFGVGLLL